MKPEKLVTMANQIGAFFSSQKGDVAVQGIADHLKKSGIRECARCSLPIWRLEGKGSTRKYAVPPNSSLVQPETSWRPNRRETSRGA